MSLQGPSCNTEKQNHHSFGTDTVPRKDCEEGNSEPIDTAPLRNIWHESIYIFIVTAAQLITVRILYIM